MNRVVHFEFEVENQERSIKFYSEVFGWKISNWGGPINYWLISTGPKEDVGIDGGMSLRSERDKNLGSGTLNTIEVSELNLEFKLIMKRYCQTCLYT